MTGIDAVSPNKLYFTISEFSLTGRSQFGHCNQLLERITSSLDPFVHDIGKFRLNHKIYIPASQRTPKSVVPRRFILSHISLIIWCNMRSVKTLGNVIRLPLQFTLPQTLPKCVNITTGNENVCTSTKPRVLVPLEFGQCLSIYLSIYCSLSLGVSLLIMIAITTMAGDSCRN